MKSIIFLLILGVGGAFLYNKHLETELKDEEKRLQKEDARLSQLENEVQSKKSFLEGQKNQEAEILVQVRKQLAAKSTERSSLGDRLNLAKNFNYGDQRLKTTNFDIQHKKENIINLENQLKAVNSQISGVDGQGKYSVEQQKITYQNEDLLYNQNILIEKQKLKNLEDTYNSLKRQRNDLTIMEQARQMPPQIANEKLSIQKLQTDRQALKANWESNRNSITQNNSGPLSDLKAQQESLKAQLQQEKNDLQKLNVKQRGQSGQTSSEKNDIKNLQGQISDLESAIKSLQDQIRDHEARLKQLGGA